MQVVMSISAFSRGAATVSFNNALAHGRGFQLSEPHRAPIGAMAIPAKVAVQLPPPLGGVKINPNLAVPLATMTAW
jgi:hypothetical protein